MSETFQTIPECQKGQFNICEAYLSMDFTTQLVSYSFTTADANEMNTENSSSIRTDLVADQGSAWDGTIPSHPMGKKFL